MQDLAFAPTGFAAGTAARGSAPEAGPWQPPGDGRAQQALSSAECARLLDLLDRLELVDGEQQFKDLLDGPMQGLLPHRTLECRTGPVPSAPAGDAPPGLLLNGFAANHPDPMHQPGSLLLPVLTDRWLHTRKPVLVELLHDTRSWPPGWVQDARQHGFSNLASHAFLEAGANTFTHFCFADLPGRLAPRHAHLLRLLVPHLHLALRRIAGPGTPAPRSAPVLHPHQLDVLRWLHVGKTNWEISVILGMSVHNVKYHVAQLLVKLDAANRVHAVARARECGLLDDRPPTPRPLPARPR